MAVDRRQKNVSWHVAGETAEGEVSVYNAVRGGVILAVLMDLRDELQAIHRLMMCHNVAAGFRAMQSVDRRLARGIVTRRPAAKKRGAKR